MDSPSPNSPSLIIIEKNPDDGGSRVTGLDKTLITIIITIVFIILALPIVFKLTNKATRLVGVRTVNDSGCPTVLGVVLHAVVFAIVIRLLMQ